MISYRKAYKYIIFAITIVIRSDLFFFSHIFDVFDEKSSKFLSKISISILIYSDNG